MTIEVHYTRKGEKRVASFESEQAASIFLTGLDNREEESFDHIAYPDETNSDPYNFGSRSSSSTNFRDQKTAPPWRQE